MAQKVLKGLEMLQKVYNLTVKHWKPFQSRFLQNRYKLALKSTQIASMSLWCFSNTLSKAVDRNQKITFVSHKQYIQISLNTWIAYYSYVTLFENHLRSHILQHVEPNIVTCYWFCEINWSILSSLRFWFKYLCWAQFGIFSNTIWLS